MTAHAHIDWPTLAEPVARIVWGAPSMETKDELRWGMRGSRVLNRAKGTWFDHEANCGGGTLDLVPGGAVGERIQWLRDRRLIEDPQHSNGGGNGDGGCFNIIATYDYTDETGALLFQVCRLVPKDFRQRRPDRKGGWAWKLGDTRRVLYRLPELCEAIAQRRPIYIVEGEKDVESLRKLGLVATCNVSQSGGQGAPSSAAHDCAFRRAPRTLAGSPADSQRLETS
jgi:hypothetical protein